MEKVKITQEQNRAISELMEHPYNNTKDELLKGHTELGGFVTLNDLDIDLPLLAKVLYGRYEVEPEFKVGDWVKSTMGYPVGKVTKIGGLGAHTDFGQIGSIRHATPEEIATEKKRRWWVKHDREVWELKKGDIIRKFVIDGAFYGVTHVDGEYIGLFDIGRSRIETEEIDIVSGGYRVVCFADNRKDI